jgi:hypothetical protein
MIAPQPAKTSVKAAKPSAGARSASDGLGKELGDQLLHSPQPIVITTSAARTTSSVSASVCPSAAACEDCACAETR